MHLRLDLINRLFTYSLVREFILQFQDIVLSNAELDAK